MSRRWIISQGYLIINSIFWRRKEKCICLNTSQRLLWNTLIQIKWINCNILYPNNSSKSLKPWNCELGWICFISEGLCCVSFKSQNWSSLFRGCSGTKTVLFSPLPFFSDLPAETAKSEEETVSEDVSVVSLASDQTQVIYKNRPKIWFLQSIWVT